MTIRIMTLLITTLLIITLNMGKITYHDITYNLFYLQITLLITVNKKHTCNVAFINVISKVPNK
jgi:hypothetical protein